jgi:hypothetical protein
MSEASLQLAIALALILVIEGLLYAIFPDIVKRMMEMAIKTDRIKLRRFGLAMAIAGVGLVWLFQHLH